MEGDEWNIAAHGKKKRELAGELAIKLKNQFSKGSLLHYGQGKWYPGEPLPRWAISMFWRVDGKPIWRDETLFSDEKVNDAYTEKHAAKFAKGLAMQLGLPEACLIPAYEDVVSLTQLEQRFPDNIDPLKANLTDSEDRQSLAMLLEKGLGKVAGYVMPLKPVSVKKKDTKKKTSEWLTSKWPMKREHLYLLSGDSPMGLRLPLDSLPWVLPKDEEPEFTVDPFEDAEALDGNLKTTVKSKHQKKKPMPREVIHTALCVQVRNGRLYVFMPPTTHLEDYLALISVVEETASALQLKLWIEGYTPPRDARIKMLSVTPDPGVIEVNIHPAGSWKELVSNVTNLYEIARKTRLGTEKFMLDGRHTGTGGGNHATLGGATAADSPLLRRPDVLKSLITYWQNHPSLSYLFSGTFIGPTSQAPRIDEARDDNLYELEIAFQQMELALPKTKESKRPWLVDRLLRHLLVDLTGNTHRSEFSIDKLYSPDGPTGRLGL
ncbi:unnamed protein product, partial [Chrysoparadoxa australica]